MSVSPEAPAAGARDRALARFRERWGAAPAHLIRSPGRVLLMGEHTDYHDGLALTVAIPQGLWLAMRTRADGTVVIESEGREGVAEIDLQTLRKGDGAWPESVRGVAATLQSAGARVCGWEGCVASDLPEGAGLASSTSFALALVRAFAVAAGTEWHPVAAAHVAQEAERAWVGAPCAAADVLAVAAAQDGFATLVDGRTRELRPVSVPSAFNLVLLDLGLRGSADRACGPQRLRECAQVLSVLGAASLRDVSVSAFAAQGLRFSDLSRRRARYVVTEHERVVQAARALGRGDGEGLGILMNMSHNGLRDDYGLPSPELETAVQAARSVNGCAGARRSGNCVVAVVAAWAGAAFLGQIGARIRQVTGRDPVVHPLHATAGTDVVEYGW